MKEKIGIATLYTGFNFGSSLQAYATKTLVEELGYEAEIWKVNGSVIKGRDIRINKLLTMMVRALFVKNAFKQFKNYQNGYAKKISEESKDKFLQFARDFLNVKTLTYSEMKKIAKTQEYKAFVCGSDQIWSGTALYVDKFYYLQFAPQEKRIALAPSFGKDTIPDYNKKKIKKYVSQIPYKSVRESSGANIIKMLTGESAPALLDPTLLLSKKKWLESFNIESTQQQPYIVAYFLDKPSEKVMECVSKIAKKHNLKILNIPYDFSMNGEMVEEIGPCEFLSLMSNAKFVCTDSFHGTAFALNFNIPFYTFERNYGLAEKQSTRIYSILEKVQMLNRYEPKSIEGCWSVDFDYANSVLDAERNKARNYLKESLENI